jgi:transposase
MFADEARFGRMNRIRPCWAPLGTRPAVAAQLIREYIYLYGAVSPKDGTYVYLIMPTSNTASFQAFLHVLARRFSRQDILLVVDGAPNHRCGALVVPRNIRLLYLPPYSPELNPKENLWDEIREKIQKLRAQIHGRRARQAQAGHPLSRAQSQARPLHHFIPLYRQLTLMQKRYKKVSTALPSLSGNSLPSASCLKNFVILDEALGWTLSVVTSAHGHE